MGYRVEVRNILALGSMKGNWQLLVGSRSLHMGVQSNTCRSREQLPRALCVLCGAVLWESFRKIFEC